LSKVIHVEDIGQLHDLIATEGHLVVKFTAPSWCQPCRQLAPHYEAAAEKSEAVYASVDIDDVPEAVSEFNIMGVPTVKMYVGGLYASDIKGRTVLQLLSETS
jgi:thiol-disulfide isomerase/thioredoxin